MKCSLEVLVSGTVPLGRGFSLITFLPLSYNGVAALS